MKIAIARRIAIEIMAASSTSELMELMRNNLTKKEWRAFRKEALRELIDEILGG